MTSITPKVPGHVDPDKRVHQPFPYMPTNKEGVPYYVNGDQRQPVILHNEDEEKDFRSKNDDVADRVLPPPAPEDELAQLRAVNEELAALNQSLTDELAAANSEIERLKTPKNDKSKN